jgi:hypothetical protein
MNRYLLPRIDQLQDILLGAQWFTAIDIRDAYYPSFLSSIDQRHSKRISGRLALAYLDDVLIFSKTLEDHIKHVRRVLEKLKEKEAPVKLSKREFYKHRIAFLGYIVSETD